MKTGLILEGGAMRGMFTAGVMDVLMEAGVAFDGVIGVSAGACFGCNYKSGQIGRVLRYNLRFCNDKRYMGARVFLREGNLYSTPFCYEEVPMVHDPFDFDAFGKNPMEFWVVCTDVQTGKPVYHRYEGLADHRFDWIRASASMPLVSRIVRIDGQKLLDGGISDSVPVDFFESIARRHINYHRTLDRIAQRERRGELLVIRPKAALQISKTEHDPEKLRSVYDQGREAALEALDRVRTFLKEERV